MGIHNILLLYKQVINIFKHAQTEYRLSDHARVPVITDCMRKYTRGFFVLTSRIITYQPTGIENLFYVLKMQDF